MCIALCACSSDDETTSTQADSERLPRLLTIGNAALTRATIDASTLAAAWATDDHPTYVNLSALPTNVYYGQLTPTEAKATTALQGTVTCSKGDMIALCFPTTTPVQPSGEDAYYPITLSGQKGTLADIGAHYHYVYGVAEIEEVDGNTATGNVQNMKSLLSLCKFTFTYGGNPLSVTTVQLGWGTDGSNGYPLTGKVVLKDNPDNVSAVGDAPTANFPLTITLDAATSDGVYVALFPCDDWLTFHFTVSDGTRTYTATKEARMLEGKYYAVTVAVTE